MTSVNLKFLDVQDVCKLRGFYRDGLRFSTSKSGDNPENFFYNVGSKIALYTLDDLA
ncbi:hypothetical protein [Halobacillus seohaensis]|uniref:Glyoxalase n=1 Tax=Halobacillus seohaensis TaxID=447421 RepID=A0ABW2EPR7_9BACI